MKITLKKQKAIRLIHILAMLLLGVFTGGASSEEKIEMEMTVFKGNRELPKVLYIVPWKRLADANIKQKLVLHSLFEDAFDPIEPEAFHRYVEDYKHYARKPVK